MGTADAEHMTLPITDGEDLKELACVDRGGYEYALAKKSHEKDREKTEYCGNQRAALRQWLESILGTCHSVRPLKV